MKIHQNNFYIGLLIILLLASIGYSLLFGWKYYTYITLNTHTTPSLLEGSIVKEGDDQYQLLINYRFIVDGQEQSGKTLYREIYRNTWGAEEALKAELKNNPQIWYQKSDSNHSTLQKFFPLKECISTIVLWILLIYFAWLGFYVATYRT